MSDLDTVEPESSTPLEPAGIESEVLAWANERELWQQEVIRKLASGATFSDDEIEVLAQKLVDGKESDGTAVTASDIPRSEGEIKTVSLSRIGNVQNINALLPEQSIDFPLTGLTLVYGDNGSGKSGYARVIKQFAGARHEEDVLKNVFTGSDEEQQVEFKFRVNGENGFDPGAEDPFEPLLAIQYYDEACGDVYIEDRSELSYRPSILDLFDRLVHVCGRIDAVIAKRLAANAESKPTLPDVHPDSAAGKYLGVLSADTTPESIEVACGLPPTAQTDLAETLSYEQRLATSSPANEKMLIAQRTSHLATIRDHCNDVVNRLKKDSIDHVDGLKQTAIQLRAAAQSASADKFDDEPIPGIGSESWRALWEAARAFSEAEAYHEHDFPVTENEAVCVLCQQQLVGDGADRMRRFAQFISDDTEQKARAAEAALAEEMRVLRDLAILPANVSNAIAQTKTLDESLSDEAAAWLSVASEFRTSVVAFLEGSGERPNEVEDAPREAIQAQIDALGELSEGLDDAKFQSDLQAVTARKQELQSAIALADRRTDVEAEVRRLGERRTLESAKTHVATGPITRRATELATEHATEAVRQRFQEEALRLRVPRIELKMEGGAKAKQFHAPSLVGAVRSDRPKQVLSEGEQTAVSLAGFFTEAELDDSKSAMVLDDPVCSLDHKRRSLVAERIVEFAEDRQVVIFTHDIVFLRYLIKAAAARTLEPNEAYILTKDEVPGLIKTSFPWKAKDSKAQLGELEAQLDRIKRDRTSEGWDDDRYANEVSVWAGRLSEVWENMVEELIVNEVINPGTSAVHVDKFKIFVEVSDEDKRELKQGYGFSSEHATRHRNSAATNSETPDDAALSTELTRAREWHGRVRQYRN